jgi:hypothetical protein
MVRREGTPRGLVALGLGVALAPPAACTTTTPSGSAAALTRAALELRLPPRVGRAVGVGRDVFAIGDVHGDVVNLARLLRATGLTDEQGRWAAGDSVLIQTGDLLDRHGDDLEALRLLRRLRRGAREAGGEVAWLLGNHEWMNFAGQFACVPADGFPPFDRLMRRRPAELVAHAHVPAHERARHAALAPGGLVARALAAPIALVVEGTLFAHGGVRAAHVPHLASWNAQAIDWLRGAPDAALPVAALARADAPVWTRRFSQSGAPGCEPPTDVCAEVEAVLRATDCARLVVGHTPQPHGANCACAGRVWRVDTGLSQFFGGNAECLRIDGRTGEQAICSLAPSERARPVWLSQRARTAGPRPPASIGPLGGPSAARSRDVLDLPGL